MLLHQTLSTLLLAESYRDYSYLMPWLAAGYSFLIVAQFFERLCYARDKTAAVSLIETIGALASICLAIPLISFFGIDGAAWAVPCYFLVQMMLARFLAKKPAIGAPKPAIGAPKPAADAPEKPAAQAAPQKPAPQKPQVPAPAAATARPAAPSPVAPNAAASRAAPAKPAPAPAAALTDDRVRELHARLVEAKRQTKDAGNVSVEGLAKSLKATEAKLREQHKNRKIDFDVVIKDGRAILKPIVR